MNRRRSEDLESGELVSPTEGASGGNLIDLVEVLPKSLRYQGQMGRTGYAWTPFDLKKLLEKTLPGT